MSLDSLIQLWRTDPDTAPNLPVWRTSPARPAQTRPFPQDMPPALCEALSKRGIAQLYSHQLDAWQYAREGRNLVLATGTASGKTLAYNLPVVAALLAEPSARALYLFPTKALSQDQLSGLQALMGSQRLPAAIYDGDTPQGQRSAIRKNARIILSNPDMLHTGILPHHTNWADFFRGLRYVVIDEVHSYRGVFGSHIANVVRRLKRVANFYGSHPQFILTSATIGNPQELAARLIEAPVELIEQDGSSRGARHFLLYNPPVVDEALGLRKSALMESVRLAQNLLTCGLQSVIFARSRRTVEMLLTYLQESRESRTGSRPLLAASHDARVAAQDPRIRGYRSGYLPSQRREIEQGLRSGELRMVVATNALELGIDIGGLGAAVLVGYPGSIASVYQQSGRAGRGDAPALSVMVASPNPLDQFLAHHPDYFFGKSPEQALINPDHLLILLNHLRCALFELPFQKGEGFGSLSPETVQEVLEFLTSNKEVHLSQDKYFWMSDAYPAANISLRSASAESVVLQTTDDRPRIIGQVDFASACWMVHPDAIYIHEGQQYFVHELNLEKKVATLTAVALDYYTEPQRETEIQVLSESALAEVPGGEKGWGEIQVTTQIVGFKKLRWFTQENLGEAALDLPPTELQTTGYWLTLSNEAVESLRQAGAWTNDPNDYGADWARLRLAVRTRDGFRCRVCGTPENGREHDVHHKVPFRSFTSIAEANRMDNLVTLCPACHRKAEQNVRIRSGLAGLSYVLSQLAPLFLMCDPGDLGMHTDAAGTLRGGSPSGEEAARPSVVLYDQVPAGIGFSQKLFEMHADLVARALELVSECECKDGCPSCVGPGGENGAGGKQETLEILRLLQVSRP